MQPRMLMQPQTALAQSTTGTEKAAVRGNPDAPVGGIRRDHFAVSPTKLHPLNATDYYSNQLLDRIYETLAEPDVETMEFIPRLAERWEVSKDKKRFTFTLNPKARWQDGNPVTAEDVRYSFEVLFHPKLLTRAKWSAYYGKIEKAEILDDRTVRFTAREDHFQNFINLASLRIVPAHAFNKDNPDKTSLSKKPMGSGAYRLQKWEKNKLVILEKDGDYWGQNLPQNIGRYNASLLLTKIISTNKVSLEAFKKGDLDVYTFTPAQWVREAVGKRFGEGRESKAPLIKLDVQNKAPRGYRYVGWNLESELFKDRKVRRAMSHLFDRETFIKKFYFNLNEKAVGLFQTNSRYSSPKVKPIPFSIPKAIALLKEAGWSDTDGDNLLDKNGKPFRFTIMTADADTSVKVLTLAKEAMRKAGVDMQPKVVDWSTLLSLIDDYRFDAVMLGWSRSAWPDPTALWHSRSAVKGGLNLVRYRNKQVDALIDKGTRSIPDKARVPLFRKIHEIIYRDQPYTFLLERNHQLFGYRSVLRHVKPYYNYEIGLDYWWIDQPAR